jgi:hypothetical protein
MSTRAGALLASIAALLCSCHVPELFYADATRAGDASSALPGDEAESPPDGAADVGAGDAPGGGLGPGDEEAAPTRDATGPLAGTCSNGVKDDDESSVDCGGSECPRCAAGRRCGEDSDCISAFCHRSSCAQATCVDHIKNLNETDIDCGGSECHPCNVGASCLSATDCALDNCVESKCQPASCDDHLRSSGETDIDCGGTSCAPCAAGRGCLTALDCDSKLCAADGTCAVATCLDDVQNGGETDKDCGGPACPRCAAARTCRTGADCAAGVCATTCQAPSCSDQVMNGGETDVDCGGSCPARCRTGERCGADSDCAALDCEVTCQACPRGMVAVSGPPPGRPYCIDATEVTVEAYARFLLTGPPPSSVPAVCAYDKTYVPGLPLDLTRPSDPVRYVDWCDAATFCIERGLHLCGRIGERSPLLGSEELDRAKSEWLNACMGPSARAFPYGDIYDASACSGADRRPVSGVWTAQANTCEGGTAGLFDMSGNVAEWEDNCTGASGAKDTCEVRGGSYEDGGGSGEPLACAGVRTVRRATNDSPAIGFRCCL